MIEGIPKVSIMIPTYNQENYIRRALVSAMNQSYCNLEIIISDDCSSSDIYCFVSDCLAKDERVKFYRNEINIGRVANYRKLLYEYSSGDYVVNLDGDDFFTDMDFISEAINSFMSVSEKSRPIIYFACKNAQMNDELSSSVHLINSNEIIISGVDYVKKIFTKYRFSHLSTLYNRSVALKCNFYSIDIESADQESLFRMALLGRVIVSNRIIGTWNFTGNNFSHKYEFEKSIANLLWIKSVKNKLRGKLNFIELLLWGFRCKVVYSYPFIKEIQVNRRLSKGFFLKMFHNNMLLPFCVKFIKMIYVKIK